MTLHLNVLIAFSIVAAAGCSSLDTKTSDVAQHPRNPAQASPAQPTCGEILGVFKNVDVRRLCLMKVIGSNAADFKSCVLKMAAAYDSSSTEASAAAANESDLSGLFNSCSMGIYNSK